MGYHNTARSFRTDDMPYTDAVNAAGGAGYLLSPKAALAQYVSTGCFRGTYYTDGKTQINDLRSVCANVDDEFIAKAAVYGRERSFMRDAPALLCAELAARKSPLLRKTAARVIDNGKQLRNFVAAIRSGDFGRKSLGTAPRAVVRNFLSNLDEVGLLRASVGTEPKLGDIVRMAHPKPNDHAQSLFFIRETGHDPIAGWEQKLPVTSQLVDFRSGRSNEVPQGLPFELCVSENISPAGWINLANSVGWLGLLKNLNTFQRHDVFKNQAALERAAARLRDQAAVERARVMPHQVMAAFYHLDDAVPSAIREAVQDAMEHALANVPAIEGPLAICVDTSGSMASPATGYSKGNSSKMRVVDVAALMASALLRKNKEALVVPFDTVVHPVRLNPRDSVFTNAKTLASFGGGGTNCAEALRVLNAGKWGGTVVYLSDNESWVDGTKPGPYSFSRATGQLAEFEVMKGRHKNSRMACVNLTPSSVVQSPGRSDIINIGGFSDNVYTLLGDFASGRMSADSWVRVIEEVRL